jgi:hypothetical protein
MARTKFSRLRDAVVAKPGAAERLAGLRAETLEDIRLYELVTPRPSARPNSPAGST